MTGRRSWRRLLVLYLAGLLMVVWSIGPTLWMALASVVPQGDFTRARGLARVDRWSLDAYRDVLGESGFRDAIRTSAIVAVSTTVLCLVVCALAGYALARLRPHGGRSLGLVLLSARAVPALVLLIPLYLFMSRILDLADTIVGLVLVQTALLSPFAVWMLRTFFAEVPRSVELAARIDGCNRLQVFRHVTLPLSLQGLVATAVFLFINTWNEFMIPLILSGSKAKTVTVELAQLSSAPGGFFQFGPVMAAGIATVLPSVVFFLLTQRALVRGVTAGGVKA